MSELHVVFGAGPLGKWTARELVQLGKKVRIVNRSGQVNGLPEEVEVIGSDAYDARKNIELTRGAEAIYQCAQPHYHEWVEKFMPLQNAILEAAAANGAKLIVGDNLYMYGDPQGRIMREDSPLAPNSKKGQVRAAMAQQILDAHASGRVRAAIGRASDFFGPEDSGLTSYAILPALQDKPVNLMGRVDQLHTFTYAPDFGKLLATLGTHEEALGQIWFTPSKDPLTQAQFVGMIEEQLGRRVKSMVGSKLMLQMLGMFKPELKELAEMTFLWTGPYIIDARKAEQAFGLRPTPIKDAIRATLDWCRKEVANS